MLFTLLVAFSESIPLPVWPKQYRLRGTWNIPYQRIRIPFQVYTDGNERQVDISYNGLMSNIHIVKSASYQIQVYGNGTDTRCLSTKLDASQEDSVIEYLPTNNDEWVYDNIRVVLGKKCHSWTKSLEKETGRKDWYYTFYALEEDLTPIRIFQHGRSIRHSHPADYLFDIEDFGPTIDEKAFDIPARCYDSSSGGPTKTSKYAKDISAPKYITPRNSDYCPVKEYKNSVKLPDNFTWRNVPNVLGMPRDQANCGSCWAQSAANTISTTFSIMLNKTVTISIQQVMDATWRLDLNPPNDQACSGGEADIALDTIKNVPLANEEDYPYIGIGGRNGTKVLNPIGAVTGCYHVQPSKDDVMTALYTQGPLSISILASLDSFVNFDPKSEDDVYDDENCDPSKTPIDHCVLLTGWKKINGKLYWEIQNSWSDVWGYKGYALISDEHDCGLKQFAFLPVVTTELNSIQKKANDARFYEL